jgi:3'-5' exoribonuclease
LSKERCVKKVYAKDIKAGDKVSDTFLVLDKGMAFSQKGTPYLSLRLRDRTGDIDGRIWDRAVELDGLFKKGDVVHIQARAANYKNVIQLSIVDIRKTGDSETDLLEYAPSSRHDLEEMYAAVTSYVEQMGNPHLKALLEAFFRDEEVVVGFKQTSAAKGFHHVYIGGLLEHTLSVVRLLDRVAEHYGLANRDLLIAGGILHDIGKIRELSPGPVIDYTDPGRLIGHIVLGVEMLNEKITLLKEFPSQLAMELRHIILSHHGILEYGSPKRPKTVEALIIHYIDDMDAKVNAFQRYIENSQDDESDWTPFHRLFERFIYKGKNTDPAGE